MCIGKLVKYEDKGSSMLVVFQLRESIVPEQIAVKVAKVCTAGNLKKEEGYKAEFIFDTACREATPISRSGKNVYCEVSGKKLYVKSLTDMESEDLASEAENICLSMMILYPAPQRKSRKAS